MDQIDRKIREEQISINRNQVKALVIKGMSMAEAISEITRKEAEHIEPIPELPVSEEPLTQERYDALMKKYSDLQDEQDILSEKMEDANRMIEYLRFREDELSQSLEIINRDNYWRVKRDREVRKKASEIRTAKREDEKVRKRVRQLEEHLERLIGVKRLEMRGDMLAIKTIPHFTRESIEEYTRKVGIRAGDIILFEDASGGGPQTASVLIDCEIRAVIIDTPLSHLSSETLIEAVIPIIEADSVELQRIDEFAFISRKRFEKQFQEFMAETKEKARQRSEDQLVDIVEEYRAESK
jgi:hypothetical protein